MALSKRSEYKVEILPSRVLQVRRADIIEEDGEELATSYHRHVVNPGDDVSCECECVQLIAPVLHTPQVIAAYRATLPEPEPEPELAPSDPEEQSDL